MYYKHFIRPKPKYTYYSGDAPSDSEIKSENRFFLLITAAVLLLFIISAFIFLNDISSQIAISDACDIVTVRVNRAVSELFDDEDYSADSFVSFEKSENGDITAVNCNMARINALSAEILDKTVNSTENSTITVAIPIGNLTGVSLLMGRGPKIPVKILMLTSSRVEFSNNLISAGINQTKHQINLNVIVDVDILLPWGTESSQVVSEVMIADTVVVGSVPQTYLNMQ
ncbi:MAG: sporulation protein YunB [Eubacteriales bacterium]|nr:sporulation protein YunB [Eubacteriales bacterium]